MVCKSANNFKLDVMSCFCNKLAGSNQRGRLSLSSQRIVAGMKCVKFEKTFPLGAELKSPPPSGKWDCVLKEPGVFTHLGPNSQTHG